MHTSFRLCHFIYLIHSYPRKLDVFISVLASVFSNYSLQVYQFLPSSPLTLYPDWKDFCICFQYFNKTFFLSKKGDIKSYNTAYRNGKRNKYLFWYTFNEKHFVRWEDNWLENTGHILITGCMSRKKCYWERIIVLISFVETTWDVSRQH